MKRTFKILIFLFILMGLQSENSGFAQQNSLPFRNSVNPNEMVSLSAETNFQTAIQILSNFSKQYTGKILIDNSGYSGSIGMNIPSMPWRQALEYMVRANNLQLLTHPDYFEIVPPALKDAARKAAGNINLDTYEIEISATFFEGNRRKLRELGIDWSLVKDGVIDIRFPGTSFFSEDSTFGLEVPKQQIANTGWEVEELFKALESNNHGKILSSPTVKVVAGEEGRIQVGQDFSIKQRDFSGNIIETFFSTGTIAEVIPNVIEIGDTTFVHLTIHAEKSSAQPDPVSTIINKQEATTQVLLLDGEETIIGGLYITDESKVRKGIPVLKDLPWWFFGLRYLFGYESIDASERELVILMKAHILPTIRQRANQRIRDMEELLQQKRSEHPRLEQFDE